jgi:hypothetical protein
MASKSQLNAVGRVLLVITLAVCILVTQNINTTQIQGIGPTSALLRESSTLTAGDDTPVKTRSSSTSDLPKKVVSPERSLVLPPVMDTDRYEALCVQLETVRLNGACALDLKQSLIAEVNKLSDVSAEER